MKRFFVDKLSVNKICQQDFMQRFFVDKLSVDKICQQDFTQRFFVARIPVDKISGTSTYIWCSTGHYMVTIRTGY
jgi:hypothetical protein